MAKMNYESLWKTLEELMAELVRKGVTIPPDLMGDLKSAKSYISIYKTNSTAIDIGKEIELYMENIERNLLCLAESDVGKDYADKWLTKIYRARIEAPEPASTLTGFITAIPKGEYWIRIDLSGLMADKDVNELLETLNLSSTPQERGYLIVHGREENVKAFVRKVSEKIGKKRK